MRSEEEQIEVLRDWWARNGSAVLIGVLVAVAAVVGMRFWNSHNANQAQGASIAYEKMLGALAQVEGRDDTVAWAEVEEQADQLRKDYGSTVYASHAGLALARKAVAAGDYDAAAGYLNDVIKADRNDALVYTARLRLARVDIQRQDFDAALATLKGRFPVDWSAQVAELRGDALRQKGEAGAARGAYDEALAAAPQGDSLAERIRMKLDDLAPAS
ncbi:YfgM family protein [Isoalcanivorax beigongshangi]|uniref:Ancillary SecYEG translocon subunit n=1 Tax=Isoalcanivorax beigongshangi TaxID=3238810 RepID=A0ABV4AIZ6_9GAMM